MNDVDKQSQALSQTFHCLADPSRRRIVALLRESGRLRVSDIAKVFDISLVAVSKHLKTLEAASVISREVQGRVHWISLQWPALKQAYEWLDFYHSFWSTRLDALEEAVNNTEQKE